jgi:hypothetical protein
MRRRVTSRRAVAPKSMVAPESAQECPAMCVLACSTSHATDGQRHRYPEYKHEAQQADQVRVPSELFRAQKIPPKGTWSMDPGWSRLASEIWRVIVFSGLLTDTPRLQSYPSLGTLTTTIYGIDLGRDDTIIRYCRVIVCANGTIPSFGSGRCTMWRITVPQDQHASEHVFRNDEGHRETIRVKWRR